jgi:hypothetical protein
MAALVRPLLPFSSEASLLSLRRKASAVGASQILQPSLQCAPTPTLAGEDAPPQPSAVHSLARSWIAQGADDGSRVTRERPVRLCVQERWTRSAGTKPAEARIRSLVAWIARWRETKTLEPIDDTIGRMVANHQAVARANAYVASKGRKSGGRTRNREGEGNMGHRNLIDAMSHSGGVEATAW